MVFLIGLSPRRQSGLSRATLVISKKGGRESDKDYAEIFSISVKASEFFEASFTPLTKVIF